MANFRKPLTTKLQSLLLAAVVFFVIVGTGCSKRQITRPTFQIDAEEKFWIRVLLYSDKQSCSLYINSSFKVIDSASGIVVADFAKTEKPSNLQISEKKIILADNTIGESGIIISPNEPYIFTIDSQSYRGKLEIIPDANGQYFDVINHVPLEPYLAGVIAAEMPNYWESAALEAQTVSARTYSLYLKKYFGKKRNWDVKKTQASQVYHGLKAESGQVWAAVHKTFGQVLTCRGADGSQDIFPTYYGSICGGHTENSRNVFGGKFFKPLAGVDCRYCKKIAKRKFFFWPDCSFDKKTITRKLLKNYPQLKKLGQICRIEPQEQSEYKDFTRVTSVKLIGSTKKTATLRAEDFRLSVDSSGAIIKSTAFKIADNNDTFVFTCGRGFGHAVGLCQTGAQAMARQGKNAKKILNYYYPNSDIVNIYEKD